jgi:hypothetical protein
MKLKLLAATCTLLASSAAAFADDPLPQETEAFKEWGRSAGWVIYVDNEKSTCLMQKTYEGGHVIQIGMAKDESAYLGAFAKIPEDLRGRKQTQEVTLVVGEEAKISEKIKRGQREANSEYTGAYVEAASVDYFVQNPMAKQEFFYEGQTFPLEYSLDGVGEASAELSKCEAEQG